jgi:Protein of unknown function (DUF4245)
MAKAVLILLVPVIVAVVAYIYFFGGSNVITIDPSGTFAEARQAARFEVLVPQGLPSGYRPISSAWGPDKGGYTLRVGYIVPGGGGMQLVESDRPAAALIADELGATNAVATSVDIGGRAWAQVTGTNRALVDTEAGRTLIVLGQATERELEEFVATLR